MGGDLITTNMKPQGIRYHELVDKSEVLTNNIILKNQLNQDLFQRTSLEVQKLKKHIKINMC